MFHEIPYIWTLGLIVSSVVLNGSYQVDAFSLQYFFRKDFGTLFRRNGAPIPTPNLFEDKADTVRPSAFKATFLELVSQPGLGTGTFAGTFGFGYGYIYVALSSSDVTSAEYCLYPGSLPSLLQIVV